METRTVLVLAAAAMAGPAAHGQLSASSAIKMNDAPFLMCWAQMGWAVANGGNTNGDARGIDDILVGAPVYYVERSGRASCDLYPRGHASAWTSAARTWRQVGQLSPTGIPSAIGASLKGIGDVNGDGHGDTVVSEWNYWNGANYYGRVCVRSGFDGGIMAATSPARPAERPGTMVAAIGDVDGYPGSEFAALVPAATSAQGGAGRVDLYSYRWGGIVHLHSWEGTVDPYETLAGPIGAVGDANGDGHGDLAIVYQPAFSQAVLRVFSGVAPYKQIGPDLPGFPAKNLWLPGTGADGESPGEYIAPLTDLNGDGKAEFIVGASGGPTNRAIAMVLGATPINGTSPTQWQLHSVMDHHPGDTPPWVAHRSVAAVAPGQTWEVLVGVSGMNGVGRAYAFKAISGAFLRDYNPETPAPGCDPSIAFGCAVAGGDFNGDGLGDAVVGASDFDLDPGIPGRHGQAYLFLGTP